MSAKVEYHNDGKHKHQSWEAKIVLNSDFDNGWNLITMEAYGATKEEAKSNLEVQIKETIKEFKAGLKDL